MDGNGLRRCNRILDYSAAAMIFVTEYVFLKQKNTIKTCNQITSSNRIPFTIQLLQTILLFRQLSPSML